LRYSVEHKCLTRINSLTHDDSQRAFEDYRADAQKRLLHDQQFPDEPKQIRPGENVSLIDNQVQVSGQMAVMAINERLFQTLLDKNPDASFAIEQSFPFKSMYSAPPVASRSGIRLCQPARSTEPL